MIFHEIKIKIYVLLCYINVSHGRKVGPLRKLAGSTTGSVCIFT